MYSLEKIGLADYYYLDNYKIYNAKKGSYIKETGNYRYKVKTNKGNYRSITLKEIYKKLFNNVFCIDNIDLLENEIFKEIEETKGNYEVSNKGRIKSKISNNAIILKPQITSKGYARLQIYIDGKRYNKFVHCLVAEA